MTPPRLRWAAFDRSLTLMRVFLLASGAILVLGAFALTDMLGGALRGQAIADAREASIAYARGVLDPLFAREGRLTRVREDPWLAGGSYNTDGELVLSSSTQQFIVSQLGNRFVSVNIWSPTGKHLFGTLAYPGDKPHPPNGGELARTIRTKDAAAKIIPSSEATPAERRLGLPRFLETYAPIVNPRGKVIGVYETYGDPTKLESSIAARKHRVWLAVAAVFALLYLALVLLVRVGSRTLVQRTRSLRLQSRQLADAYERLEESSMEAIASLNATVDARDPYTAGHSQRVQRIALAIAGELGLEEERMQALAFGALFHDIGKLGVPDAILLKPGRLTDEEYGIIKRHAEKGAEIVGRFSPLRPAVPVIRHHHERFAGGGYPHGLEGPAIPLEAAIVGLADAWDAMTTDRPYRSALADEEALAEIVACRGTQFDPDVVDAFMTAYEADPARFGLFEDNLTLPQLRLVAS